MKRVRANQFLLIMLSIILCLSLAGCKDKNEITPDGKIMVATINYEDDLWEIYRNTDNTDVSSYIFKNGVYDSTEKSSNNKVSTMISIPNVEVSNDLDRSNKITDNTYKCSIVQAMEYINKLKNEGHSEVLSAKTANFYELYLQKDGSDRYIRIIVAPGYLIEYGTSQISFNITDYIL